MVDRQPPVDVPQHRVRLRRVQPLVPVLVKLLEILDDLRPQILALRLDLRVPADFEPGVGDGEARREAAEHGLGKWGNGGGRSLVGK